MVVQQEARGSRREPGYEAAIVRQFDQATVQERRRRLYDRLPRLYGSGVKFDPEGNIYIRTHMVVEKRGFDMQKYVQVYPPLPQANILSEGSQYGKIRRPIIDMPEDVETAIRKVRHILDNLEDKERRQVNLVDQRVHELLDRFRKNAANLTDAKLEDLRRETYTILSEAHLNPAKLKEEDKKKMVQRTIKGSGLKDRLGRRNPPAIEWLLDGAHNDSMRRLESLNTIGVEFSRDLKALEYERRASRELFADIARRIRPKGDIQASALFRNPDMPDRDRQERNLVNDLDHIVRDLKRQIHLNSYRRVGLNVAQKLEYIKQLVAAGQEEEVRRLGLFQQAWLFLMNELQRGEEALERKEVE